jgi:hypothetical protein
LVSGASRRSQLFENVVRLRRASRECGGNGDIAAVRQTLEAELGETVSQRLAAALLGVSHTTLARWIKRGDIPTVYAPDGRTQVPVAALLDLHEAVAQQRASGTRTRHLLEPVIAMNRQRARELALNGTILRTDADPGAGHSRAERRSLVYHRAVASRLDPAMVQEAVHTLERWKATGRIDSRYARQWEEVLRLPLPELRQILTEDTPSARDLRQNSPFAGMLSEPERRTILELVR